MMFSPEELEKRRPVWDALSTLFLDTDTSLLRPYRVRALTPAPYSLPELDSILRDEVFPVCSWNLLSIAGEWDSFDPNWLEQRIVSRAERRFKLRLGFGHLLIVRSREWQATRNAVASARTKAAHAENEKPPSPAPSSYG